MGQGRARAEQQRGQSRARAKPGQTQGRATDEPGQGQSWATEGPVQEQVMATEGPEQSQCKPRAGPEQALSRDDGRRGKRLDGILLLLRTDHAEGGDREREGEGPEEQRPSSAAGWRRGRR